MFVPSLIPTHPTPNLQHQLKLDPPRKLNIPRRIRLRTNGAEVRTAERRPDPPELGVIGYVVHVRLQAEPG